MAGDESVIKSVILPTLKNIPKIKGKTDIEIVQNLRDEIKGKSKISDEIIKKL